jgi:acyl-CoA reductase-like NAD-dependent aldehyde dehydrogenase
MNKILGFFPSEHIAMIDGDHIISDFLLDQKFDYIFFTGSQAIGRHVMHKAAENLIPVSLELSGKNPCVVCADAHLEFAAKRVAWGKFINAGQVCVAPDYLLIDASVKDRFVSLLQKEINSFYGPEPENSPDFARIISTKSAARLTSFFTNGNIAAGAKADIEKRYISPTILTDIKPDDPVMDDEIFGPVLPVITFNSFSQIFPIISRYPKPLATYFFSRSNKLINEFMARTQSGSASINETVMQIASSSLPYGGVGPSGLGRYHGKKSFETFSNMRSVLRKSNLIDIWLRYPPYSKARTRIVSWLMSI